MRPGPLPWATNDNHPAGADPWNGNDTKVAPSAGQQAAGFEPEDRPSAEVLNWLLNRYGRLHQSAARMRALNLSEVDASLAGTGGGNLGAYAFDQLNRLETAVFFLNGMTISECTRPQTLVGGAPGWGAIRAIYTPGAGPPTWVGVDADADHNGRRMVVGQESLPVVYGDVVYSSLNGAAWAARTITGAPGLSWSAIGCDRASPGLATPMWLIGNDPGGAAQPVLYRCTNGLNFTNVAGFPGGPTTPALGTVIRGIFHTCHPADGLGYGDAGNPSWLILSDSTVSKSADGITWNTYSHSLGVMSKRSAAYSRTSGRWVAKLANAGDVAYRDALGQTRTTLSGVLTKMYSSFGSTREIVCDGYGTFVCSDGTSYWVSVDEGITWTWAPYFASLAGTDHVIGVTFDSSIGTDDTPGQGCDFTHLSHDGFGGGATGNMKDFRSLAA